MLYLIGLGLNDENDLTLKAVEIAKKCECYCELYTSIWHGSLENLKNMVGKEITILKRNDLEENQEMFLEKAKKNDIVLFVPGDPLNATTHINLVYEAKRRKIPVKIIHNASIFSAISETGLQIYKFGKAATIPLNGRLENVKETLKNNKKLGLHTLLLLDIDNETGIRMTVHDALKLLLKSKLMKEFDNLIVLSKAGENSRIYYNTVREILREAIDLPAVLIVPGKLHFKEKDFLELFQ
ncbi:MAG: diphthine synthase [Candidatus Aenigmatarchaeota archaeon]